MLAELRSLDARAKLIIIGTFLTSIALFMSIPFLSVILLDYPGMTPTKIGVIIGVSHLCSMLFGFVGGGIADYIGRSKVLSLSLLGFVLVFIGFAIARTPLQFFLLNGLNGLCQSLFRPTSEAFLSDSSRPEERAKVFGYRYMSANLGYTFGPLLGALCTQWSRGASFLTSAAIFFIYGLVFIAMLLRDQRPVTVSKPAIPFRDVLGILKKDNLMILHIVGGVLVTLVFAQITSTFAQFAKLEIPNGIWLYSTVLTINTVLVLVLQVPMSRATKNIGLMRQVMLGCLLYSVGFILMGSAKISPLLAVLGIAVITSGEVIIVPTGSTLVDALAPGELKAAYFGAAQMRMSGMFIGPIVGGFLYERIGGASSFLIMAGLSFVAALIYLHGSRAFALTSKAGNMISRIEARKHPTQEEAPS